MPVWLRGLAAAAFLIAGPAVAQTPAAPPPAEAPAPPSLSRSDLELVVTLLRNTLVALHQANITGNYTVLRDLGAPGFRDSNNAARLAEIFTQIRAREVDLSRVVLLDPQLTDARINPDGMLYLAGALATEPVSVRFELLYEAVEGVWRVFGISIAPETGLQPGAAPGAAPGATPPAAAPPAGSPPVAAVPSPGAGAPVPVAPPAVAPPAAATPSVSPVGGPPLAPIPTPRP
jgi:hypothetical protein